MQPILTGSSRHASGVARTLRRELSAAGIPCSLSRAQETVARMFGHRDWHALAAASKGRPASPPDAEAGEAESEARRERYVAVLGEAFALPPAAAARVVEAVKPTGRRQMRAGAAAYPSLDRAILDGAIVRAFRSGGGLRVIRVEKGARGGRLLGYGEAVHLREALRHADEDTAAGGRPYGEVYGKLVPCYLTGAVPEGDPLDEWVFGGHDLSATRSRGQVVARLGGTLQTGFPEDVMDRVLATGAPEEFEARGMRYRMEPGFVPDSVSYKCIRPSGDGRDPYFAHVVREARAPTLAEALEAALAAPEREEPSKWLRA